MSSSFFLNVLTAALLVASTSGFALAAHHTGKTHYKDEAPCPAPKLLKDGFYVGLQGGYDVYDVHENYSPERTGLKGNTNIRNAGWVGGLLLGYGRNIGDNFYIGAEFFGDYNGTGTKYAFSSTPLGSYSSRFTTQGSFGVSVLPGFKITNETLGYVRIGYNGVNLKIQETSTGSVTRASKHNTSSGFNYGLGLETLAYKNWSIRGEYTYTSYTTFNTGMGTYVSPADSQFMLGLVYHIA